MGAIVFAFAALGLVGIWGHRKDQGEAWRARRPEVAFWAGAALVSLLLAWGKYAPLYRLFYALPKMSSIRNPVKFLYPFEVAMAVLFAFGVEWFLGMMSAPVAEPAVASGGSTPARGADRPARTAGKRR
jgi:hypothetical protein